MKMTNSCNQTTTTLTFLAALTCAALAGVPFDASAKGTDILHVSSITTFDNSGVEAGADGIVVVTQKQQGRANNQTFSVAVSGLETNTTYELFATTATDTNSTVIANFMTDRHGQAIVEYSSLGNGHGNRKHSDPLPDNLNPVSGIREVDVVNSNAPNVLAADLTMPERLQYLVKRDLRTNQIDANLLIQATADRTHFQLNSAGLMPNTDYLLALNSDVVQTNRSDARGRLHVHSLSITPPHILAVHSVELWDTSSNIVLETTLP